MSEQEAWDRCCQVGAIPEDRTTGRTNVLVVGHVDPALLTDGATITKNNAYALDLIGRGQEIEILTEQEFLQYLAES